MYYKVVTKDLRSINSLWSPSFVVQYRIGEWIEPPIGKLFVFRRVEDAGSFLKCISLDLLIYKCEAENPLKAIFMSEGILGIRRFWEGQIHTRTYPPVGTYFADRVKLLEEVK